MKRTIQFSLAACIALAGTNAIAAAFTFTTPDLALPANAGAGLTGQLWTNVDPNTDTLAQAQAIIDGGYATANFLSSTVDYPAGPTASASTSATYASVLDATALATLDNPTVLPDDVLNTVMRFSGFFGVETAGEVWTFAILSDDGSAVDIQGTRILNNDGIHGFGGPSTTVEFLLPGLYAMDILFFESQPTGWGLELRGGLGTATPTTALTDRLYDLINYAPPDDDRLDSIKPQPPINGVGSPTALALLGVGLLGLVVARRRFG